MKQSAQNKDPPKLPQEVMAELKIFTERLKRLEREKRRLVQGIEEHRKSLARKQHHLRLRYCKGMPAATANVMEIQLVLRYSFAATVIRAHLAEDSLFQSGMEVLGWLRKNDRYLKENSHFAKLYAHCQKLLRRRASALRHLDSIGHCKRTMLLSTAREVLESKSIQRPLMEIVVDAKLINYRTRLAGFVQLPQEYFIAESALSNCQEAENTFLQAVQKFDSLKMALAEGRTFSRREEAEEIARLELLRASKAYISARDALMTTSLSFGWLVGNLVEVCKDILNYAEIERFIFTNNVIAAFELVRKMDRINYSSLRRKAVKVVSELSEKQSQTDK